MNYSETQSTQYMTQAVESLKSKDQWQILSDQERDWLNGEIQRLEAHQAQLLTRLNREALSTIYVTIHPAPVESLAIEPRSTLTDGTNVILANETPAVGLDALPNAEMEATRSEIQIATATIGAHQEALRTLNDLETADDHTRQAWIDNIVDQHFRRILDSYPLHERPKLEADGNRPRRHDQVDNAWPALIVLAIHESLCPASNRATVMARFIEDNKTNFRLKNWTNAQMMLNQARTLGLIPNRREDVEYQERQLVYFLQRYTRES